MCVYECMCVSAYVCVRERDRGRERLDYIKIYNLGMCLFLQSVLLILSYTYDERERSGGKVA